jgi:hypothetical protein
MVVWQSPITESLNQQTDCLVQLPPGVVFTPAHFMKAHLRVTLFCVSQGRKITQFFHFLFQIMEENYAGKYGTSI